MDETQETDVEIEEHVEEYEKEIEQPDETLENITMTPKERTEALKGNIKFSDVDIAFDHDGTNNFIEASKDIERLEHISSVNHERRKAEEDDEDDENEKLRIGGDISLVDLDIHDMSHTKIKTNSEPLIEFDVLT